MAGGGGGEFGEGAAWPGRHGLVVATSMPPAWHSRRMLAKVMALLGPAEYVAAVLPLRTRPGATNSAATNARPHHRMHADAAHSTLRTAPFSLRARNQTQSAGCRGRERVLCSSSELLVMAGGRAISRPACVKLVGGRSRTSTPLPPASRCVNQKSPSCPCMSSTMYSTCVTALMRRYQPHWSRPGNSPSPPRPIRRPPEQFDTAVETPSSEAAFLQWLGNKRKKIGRRRRPDEP